MANGQPNSGLTSLGKIFSVLLVVGLVGLGAWIILNKKTAPAAPGAGGGGTVAADTNGATPNTEAKNFDTSDIVDTKFAVPKLGAPAAYVPKDPNVLDIELSEYAGYAGLIVANGGLDSTPTSPLFTKYGLKLHLTISEEESWNALNAGKMAASATTADVLAAYGRQFQVVVPAQIGYSRGADGLVVRSDIHRVNDLKGKIIAAEQFTESDYFIRYLAGEAGLKINMLPDIGSKPSADGINLIYCKDGFAAGDLFEKSLAADSKTIAGCATWAPKTTEIPAKSPDRAHLLVSNKNLLIIADILIFNKAYAQKNPDKVAEVVDGLLMGNKMVSDNPDGNADVIAKAFTSKDSKWDHAKAIDELKKVHLSNLPEQLAFFAGGVSQGGSFAGIYQSAVESYGEKLIPNPPDADYFVSLDALKKAQASGAYNSQTASILPIAGGNAAMAEVDPVLSKDIRFLFEINSSKLDMTDKDNLKSLDAIKRIMDIAPGSRIVIVGHVDPGKIPQLLHDGGQELVDSTAKVAMELSRSRANEVMQQLIDHEHADPTRLERIGKGWTQPVSDTNGDLNRRVEIQWFTLE